jgi:hypothetical protein
MKPIMIYTMPRTRATVVFFCARRAIIKDEVFSLDNLDINSEDSWKQAFRDIDDPKAVLKIHGNHIEHSVRVQDWYQSVLANDVYDIFVVERPDWVNCFLSVCIANRFGFNLRNEKDPFEFSIEERELEDIEKEIQAYLKWYPKNSTKITADTMPESHFNNKMRNSENQNSQDKYKYIKNLDWAKVEIEKIVDRYF